MNATPPPEFVAFVCPLCGEEIHRREWMDLAPETYAATEAVLAHHLGEHHRIPEHLQRRIMNAMAREDP